MKFLILLFPLTLALSAFGQNQFGKYVDVNLGLGTFAPHKPAVRHLQSGPAFKGEIAYTLRTDGSQFHHKPYKRPYFGVMFGVADGGNRDLIGITSYITSFGALPLYSQKNPVVVKMGMGLGYVAKIYNKYTNPKQNAIGSHFNVNIQLRLEKNFKLNDGGGINFGFGISHFSNASFQTPNFGLNYVHLYLGKRFNIQECIPVPDSIPTITILPYKPRKIEIELHGGLKENIIALGKKYPVFNLSAHFIKQFSIKHAWSNGLDIFYNKALQHEENILLQIGISSLYVLNFDEIKIGTGLGYYLVGSPSISRGFYSTVLFQYYFNSRIFAKLKMRTHAAMADFFTIGIGFAL